MDGGILISPVLVGPFMDRHPKSWSSGYVTLGGRGIRKGGGPSCIDLVTDWLLQQGLS